eukprot:TRINITY_DN591_c0_g1_i1.p4 TRINITY_DN591_c0_g1~~TRINITY_DN591_c0_g1_i1.p4  ORF type:complete len:137 (+),score=4.04 TRINITY_DN591_c0_g1_i1:679-1089(+)
MRQPAVHARSPLLELWQQSSDDAAHCLNCGSSQATMSVPNNAPTPSAPPAPEAEAGSTVPPTPASTPAASVATPAGTPTPAAVAGLPRGSHDWRCPTCGDLQFAKNTSCRWCKQPRPASAGAPAAAQPTAREGDWN